MLSGLQSTHSNPIYSLDLSSSPMGSPWFIMVIFDFWGTGSIIDDIKIRGTVSCDAPGVVLHVAALRSLGVKYLGSSDDSWSSHRGCLFSDIF